MRKDKGIFISFEGPEGSGKTTIVKRMLQDLEFHRQSVVSIREPGGTIAGEDIRIILQHRPYELDPETEILLFEASRKELIKKLLLLVWHKEKLFYVIDLQILLLLIKDMVEVQTSK